MKNSIFDKELYTMIRLGNFVSYLKLGNFQFDSAKTFIEIIHDISNYDMYNENNNTEEKNIGANMQDYNDFFE